FLAGSLAFPYVSQIYPPLDVDLMLVVFGVIFFVALAIAVILDRRARRHQELEVLTHAYAGFILLPCIFAAFLFVNVRLDSPKSQDLRRLVSTRAGRWPSAGFVVAGRSRSCQGETTLAPWGRRRALSNREFQGVRWVSRKATTRRCRQPALRSADRFRRPLGP